MPWRGPKERGEFPSLGYEVAEWIQAMVAVPDGDAMGQPFVLTDEMYRFLLWHYRLDEDGKFVYRRSQLVRPQKWGKGPLSAAMICAEAEGPVRFDGWNAAGEPVGRPWATPWVQVTAVSEDQTDNVWKALIPMIELGEVGKLITDTGQTRINLRGGGFIEPVTASASSRLGQRITFAVQDETHSWLHRNGGWKLATNQRRNLAGMSGRSIETTNAWDPAEDSVAQRTFEAKTPDVFKDYPQPPAGAFTNKRERRKVLKAVYGDSWWVDLDRIDAEVVEISAHDLAQAERFFGNRVVTGSEQAFEPADWAAIARPDLVVPTGKHEMIVLGFDGSKFDDATALVAMHIETGHAWPLGIWERPEGASGEGWEVPDDEVSEAVAHAFDTWDVWRFYADPPYWEGPLAGWAGRYGEKRVVEWWTNRTKAMCYSLRAFATEVATGTVTHNGDRVLAEHVTNARRRVHPHLRDERGLPMWTITKDRPMSPRKIDAAMAVTLAAEARRDAIAAGVLNRRTKRQAVFL
jgi:hypothetical protein